MSKHAITRRSFLARSGAAAALAAGGGFVSFNAWEQAHADEAGGGQETTAHSLCNSCSSKCGFTGYVTDGRLGKMIGAAYMAKWLYPDLMTELDPDALFTQWMAYQGFEPNAQHYYHVPAQDAAA